MLYITTRDAKDAHTANKTLTADTAGDGGLYLPRRMPTFQPDEIADLRNQSFNETIALILNQFFSVQLSGWDVDFSIGRTPIKVVSIGKKILVAQAWHNLDNRYAYIERNIFQKLCKGNDVASQPTQWLRIAVRIAVLFATYGELLSSGQLHIHQTIDLGVDTGDFAYVVAAWYAKQMGLPIGMILCSCDENGAFWDMVHRGEVSCGSLSADLAQGIERLLYATFGPEEAAKYLQTLNKRGTYRLPEETEIDLAESLFCAVIGSNRVPTVINSVYRTDAYLLDCEVAPSYGAIQDYRSKTGSNTLTMLISQKNPILESSAVAKATGLTEDALNRHCRKM